MHQYKGKIHSTLSETTVHLDKLHQEITKTLEKIESREKYINKQVIIISAASQKNLIYEFYKFTSNGFKPAYSI